MSSFQYPSDHVDVPSGNEATSSFANQERREGIDVDRDELPPDATKSKRPADYSVSQYGKEKCRRIANDLFAKTEKFLYPAKDYENGQITDSTVSSLSSARVSEPLMGQSCSGSNAAVVQEKFNRILTTMKDFEHKFQSFKERVESTASSFIDAHSKQTSSSSQTPHNSSENTTTIEAAHDIDDEKEASSHRETPGTMHSPNVSLLPHTGVSEYPLPVSYTFTAPSIAATLAIQQEDSSNQHGEAQ